MLVLFLGSALNVVTEISTVSFFFSETKPKVPAYERFHHLATPAAPTLSLPYKYRLLAEQFRGMDQVVSMLHNRNETCTFSKLKVAVQELTKRFGFIHLQLVIFN